LPSFPPLGQLDQEDEEAVDPDDEEPGDEVADEPEDDCADLLDADPSLDDLLDALSRSAFSAFLYDSER